MRAAGHPDPGASVAVPCGDRSALAWEVLRRDPAYRAAFSALPARLRSTTVTDPAFVARWGLHFP